MGRRRNITIVTTLIAALVLGGGLAFWYRAGLRGVGSGVRADASPGVPFGLHNSPPAPPSPEPRDIAPDEAETATTGDPNRIAVSDADLRQLAKITRGMSAAAGGGIMVTATPPGSVTGQLQLRAGDVILAVDGESISSPEEFARIYREHGTPRQLTIVRDGREIHRH